jgi:hypothetical protein
MPDENEQTSPIDPLTIGEIITLSEAAQRSGFTLKFLIGLAAKGRLKARKSNKNWLTTMAAVEEYKKSRSLKNIPKKYRDQS